MSFDREGAGQTGEGTEDYSQPGPGRFVESGPIEPGLCEPSCYEPRKPSGLAPQVALPVRVG